MASTLADLDTRVAAVESKTARNTEDITAIITTVSKTAEDVADLKVDVSELKTVTAWHTDILMAIAGHLGVEVPPRPAPPAAEADAE